ncbi:hypothetical protein M9458_040935, partial [Cirrhinus mrigala]
HYVDRNQGAGLFGAGPPFESQHRGGQYSNAPPPRSYHQGNYRPPQRDHYPQNQ